MPESDPAEYELGEEVTSQFEKAKAPPGMVVSVRLERDDAKALLKEARETEHTVSQIARLAIRHYLANPQCRTSAARGAFSPGKTLAAITIVYEYEYEKGAFTSTGDATIGAPWAAFSLGYGTDPSQIPPGNFAGTPKAASGIAVRPTRIMRPRTPTGVVR